MSSRRSIMPVLLVALLIALLGIAAQTAQAASYIVQSCDASTQDRRSFGGEWEPSSYGTGTDGGVNDCPNGIVFDYDGPAPEGAIWDEFFHPGAESKLLSAQFDYYGGDDSGAYRYLVRACKEIECPIVTELQPGGSVASPTQAQFSLGTIDTSYFAVFAECVQAICPDPPPFVFKNFRMEYQDDGYPSVENLTTTPAGATDPGSGVWLRGGNLGVAFNAVDADSGVVGVWLGVGRPDQNGVITDCEIYSDSSSVCPRDLPVDTTLNLDGLEDGEHTLRIVVHDMTFMHPYVLDLPIHIDSTPPDEPSDLAFTTGVTKWGWTADPVVGLTHDDPLESSNNTSGSGWKSARFDLREGANGASVLSSETEEPAGAGEFTFPHEGAWDIGVTYKDGAGNVSNRAHRFVGLDTDRPQPPVLDSNGWIGLNQLYAGAMQQWIAPSPDPDLESGVCGYAFAVDDEVASIPEPATNVIAPATSAQLPAAIGEGRHFVHVRTIACNGLASNTATAQANVDGTAPLASVVGLGSGGWITSPPNVSVFASDTGSGVARIEYGFEGGANLAHHNGSIAPVSIPQGESTLSFRAVDAVGNAGPLQTRSVKADWTGPSVRFDTAAPSGQNLVSATVTDPESGLVTADMQIRRIDPGATGFESSWRSLGGETVAQPEGRRAITVARGIPDGELSAGTWEVRVSARDVAGNWSDPIDTKLLTLPLRTATTLSAAIAEVSAKSKINWPGASQDRVLRYGARSALVGTVLDAMGSPVAGASISIAELPEFGVEHAFGTVTTDTRGEFSAMLPKGATRTFTLRFAGSDTLQPSTETATLRSRAAVKFSVNPRRIRSGRSFLLSGRLLSADLGTPEGGKIVTIEYLRRRTWRTFATPRIDSRGRFAVRWSEGLYTQRPTTIYFHAKAQREGDWPFLTGSSETVKLRLLPPG